MSEYKYYIGNKAIRKNSIVEIRKHFIQHHTRAEATYIYDDTVYGVIGRIYWAGGSWNYHNLINSNLYEINENGRITKTLKRW